MSDAATAQKPEAVNGNAAPAAAAEAAPAKTNGEAGVGDKRKAEDDVPSKATDAKQ